MLILGVSALYHDSAAAILRDGKIVAAAQEERFSRIKHDASIPVHAILYCLHEAGLQRGDHLDHIAFYDKPLTKFTRLLTTLGQTAPRGFGQFAMGVPAWVKEKAWPGAAIERVLARAGISCGGFSFAEHHLSHAASAFFPSPFAEAAVLTADGVGEWASSSIAVGEDNNLRMLWEQRFPHSVGLLYSAFTYFCGFRVNSGEYKLMGLAPYGTPRFEKLIRDELVTIAADGSIRLNMEAFAFHYDLKMTSGHFEKLFDGPPRTPESPITRREMDLAASIQVVTEEIIERMARFAATVTGKRNLCLAGGVALNCVANGKLSQSGLFDGIWVQPAAGDAGGALGSALYAWHHIARQPRRARTSQDQDDMQGALLGPSYSREQVQQFLDRNNLPYVELSASERAPHLAQLLAQGKVLGHFDGRMEFGPRALGARSILADARSSTMQSYLNLSTKFRESFRPFAPIVPIEHVAEWFEFAEASPYMLMVAQVLAKHRLPTAPRQNEEDLVEWVNQPRSTIPAVTHVDYSARLQTVAKADHPRLHALLMAFYKLTGCPVLVNTSFNVRSEPIVCTPSDAYTCFMRTGIDALVLSDFLLLKSEQPPWQESQDWQAAFGLD